MLETFEKTYEEYSIRTDLGGFKLQRIELNELAKPDKIRLLKALEQIGKNNIRNDLYSSLLQILPQSMLKDKEFLSRYLLLAAILDQQADSGSARKTVVEIYRKYGDPFFTNPRKFLNNFDSVMSLALKIYQPKMRISRIKKEGIVLMRLGGFLLALLSLERQHGRLATYLKSLRNPQNMLSAMLNDRYLKGLLYEKAARMYVGWITHPNLYVNIFDGSVSLSSIPMPIDGHVCKVFARTGFLDTVLVEEKGKGENKKFIVRADHERKRIERMVHKYYPQGDYFMIDYGAFYVGINCCKETSPRCNKCPVNRICLRNTFVRAY